MRIDVKVKMVTNKALIYEMRQAGAPMREIAEKVGISKERVRQILERNLGSSRHAWLSTLQLCTISGLPRNRVLELYEQGVIKPETTWGAGKRHYLLWASEAASTITQHYQTHHLCMVCKKPLPKNRILFCSDSCRQERYKYKYMTLEEKQRVLDNIRRYRERKRRRATTLLPVVMPEQVVMPQPVVLPELVTAGR